MFPDEEDEPKNREKIISNSCRLLRTPDERKKRDKEKTGVGRTGGREETYGKYRKTDCLSGCVIKTINQLEIHKKWFH